MASKSQLSEPISHRTPCFRIAKFESTYHDTRYHFQSSLNTRIVGNYAVVRVRLIMEIVG